MAQVNAIPEGVSAVIPMLVCKDVSAEIEFCIRIFGAVEAWRRPGPDGNVAHGVVTINGAMVMIECEWPSLTSRSPQPDGSSPVIVYVYVKDVDSAADEAVAAGGKILLPPKDQFWGDRTARIMDPQGHVWTISSRIEETTESERKERWDKKLNE